MKKSNKCPHDAMVAELDLDGPMSTVLSRWDFQCARCGKIFGWGMMVEGYWCEKYFYTDLKRTAFFKQLHGGPISIEPRRD